LQIAKKTLVYNEFYYSNFLPECVKKMEKEEMILKQKISSLELFIEKDASTKSEIMEKLNKETSKFKNKFIYKLKYYY